jgi:hypothetical protein
MTSDLREWENFDRDTCTGRTQGEHEESHLKAKERDLEHIFPFSPYQELMLTTSQFQTYSPQECEAISFCCLCLLTHAILLWQL